MTAATKFGSICLKIGSEKRKRKQSVSPRWTRGASVCCERSFSILPSENNLLFFLNEATNKHLWCYMLRNITRDFVIWNLNTRRTKLLVKNYYRKLCRRGNFPNSQRRKKNWKQNQFVQDFCSANNTEKRDARIRDICATNSLWLQQALHSCVALVFHEPQYQKR